eukprot:4683517-Amphidinium_carterae.1
MLAHANARLRGNGSFFSRLPRLPFCRVNFRDRPDRVGGFKGNPSGWLVGSLQAGPRSNIGHSLHHLATSTASDHETQQA